MRFELGSTCVGVAMVLAMATGCGGADRSSGASPSGGDAGADPGAGPGADGGAADGGSLQAVIEGAGDYDSGTATPGSTPVGSPQTVQATGPDGTALTCTTQTYSLTSTPNQFVSSDPSSDVLWPGSLIQGASIASGLLNPIPLPRAPGTITLTLASGAGATYSQQIAQPSLSSATQAINDILESYASTDGGTPAKFSYRSEAVYSSSQLAIEAGVNASGTSWSGSASLDFDSSTTENRYLLQFTQAYFTMAFDPPAGAAAVFAPGVAATDLTPYVGPGNPALYISSVTYGRIFYLLFESTQSSTDLSAAVQASYSGGVNVDANLKAKYDSVLKNTTIKAYGIGGDAASAINAVTSAQTGRFDALSTFLTTGADFGPSSPGVPISYTVRNLADSSEVSLVFATQYTAKDCTPSMGTTANLLQNPGGDSGQLAPWVVTSGSADVHPYCSWNICNQGGNSCSGTCGSLPPDAGNYYFGGYEASSGNGCQQDGEISQTVDLAPYAAALSSGNARYSFGGWLGGYAGQDDNATMSVYFDSSSGSGLKTIQTPYTSSGFPLTEMVCEPNAIDNQNGTGGIPADATAAHVVVDFHYHQGACSNDATADSLWFQIQGPGIPDSGKGFISCP